MTEIEKLLALEEIKLLKARYFRCVDTKDWEGFKAVFAHNAHFDISDDTPDCVLTGRCMVMDITMKPTNASMAVGISRR